MVKRSPMNAIGENSRRTSFTATKFRPQIITVASIIRSVVPQARVREGGEVDVTGRLSSDRKYARRRWSQRRRVIVQGQANIAWNSLASTVS